MVKTNPRAKINSLSITGEWSTEDWLDLYKTLEAFQKRVAERTAAAESDKRKTVEAVRLDHQYKYFC